MANLEYKVIECNDTNAKTLENELNELGKEGWELKVSTTLNYTRYSENNLRDYQYNDKVLILQRIKRVKELRPGAPLHR